MLMKKLIILLAFSITAPATFSQIVIGEAAPEISLPDKTDSIINLSSFKGKVVLVDFWASWCGPCRAAIPNLLRMYKKNKAKGFEIFAVSTDKDKNEWLAAVKKMKMNYTLVIDKAGWDSKAAADYFVTALPTTFLLNKEGKLVAVDAEGRELEKLVKNLLK